MYQRKRLLAFFPVCLLALGFSARAFSQVSPEEAINHVGEQATVCGTVASTNYATGSNGQPTFLNLNRPYPRHVFTALIWGDDRPKFPYTPESLNGKDICVQGVIESYKGTAEIVVEDPSQIRAK